MRRVAICKGCKQQIVWFEEHHDWATHHGHNFKCVEPDSMHKIAWDHQPIVFNDYLNEVEKLNTK